jgi:HAD superfamily hydrolase (TIGR01509 family)
VSAIPGVADLPAADLPAALLFDMDGLLVDTEGTWFVVEAEVMAALGGPWDEEHQLALFGGPLEKAASYMLGLVDRPDVSERWVMQALVDGMVRHLGGGPVSWRPGAQDLLTAAVDAGVPCALVSSSLRPVVDAVLDAVGRHHFAATVSGDDVERTKPHPDPYLLAAELLGLAAGSCVALEDSAAGATSARAAGCRTVVVPSLAQVPGHLADLTADSLADVDLWTLGRLGNAPAASDHV